MNWEEEVQEQKDERQLKRTFWKHTALLIGGGATIIGWIYVSKMYVLPVLDRVLP